MPAAQVLLTRRLPPAAAQMLRGAGLRVRAVRSDTPMARPELLRRVAGVEALLCTLGDTVDDELLDAAGGALRIVANFAVGYDNIDVAACTQRGVRVTNTPDVLTDATADLAWALILAAARRVVEGDRLARSGEWAGWTPTQMLGLELSGAHLGIVGAGRIGTAVGLRARGFRMHVCYSHPRDNRVLEEQAAARRCELDKLLGQCDVVTLHVPLRPENRHLIGRERLVLMKPNAILINTSRGPIVDEAALVAVLRDRRSMSAGLDVYEDEPRLTPGLAELPNVVLLPHLGSATRVTRRRMAEMAAANVIAVLNGQPPDNPVN